MVPAGRSALATGAGWDRSICMGPLDPWMDGCAVGVTQPFPACSHPATTSSHRMDATAQPLFLPACVVALPHNPVPPPSYTSTRTCCTPSVRDGGGYQANKSLETTWDCCTFSAFKNPAPQIQKPLLPFARPPQHSSHRSFISPINNSPAKTGRLFGHTSSQSHF